MEHENCRHRRSSRGDRAFLSFIYAFLMIFFLLTLYPILFVVSASVSAPDAVASGKMILWPVGLNLDGYRHLLGYGDIWSGFANSIFYTVAGTMINLAVTVPAAYALSRRELWGRGTLMGLFVFTMYFSGGLIPAYLNMRSFHLLNSRLVLLISGMVSVYNLIVCRTFFGNTIPGEMYEAACLDGASDAKTFTAVVLPLSMPILAVMTLYYGEAHWNSYFSAMIYLRDRAKYPLQLILREILIEAEGLSGALANAVDAESARALMQQQDLANQLKYAVIIVATLPMLVLYPFLEKYFAQGVMIGSVKG